MSMKFCIFISIKIKTDEVIYSSIQQGMSFALVINFKVQTIITIQISFSHKLRMKIEDTR